MSATVHPRLGARRGAVRVMSWWSRAWLRAVEEAAYDDAELIAGRAVARSGRIGGVIVDSGSFVAAVEDPRGLWTVSGTLPVLDDASLSALVESVVATPRRVASLLAGDLPHDLVEHAEQLGVELLPYGGELVAVCTCASWTDPCVHALGVLTQLGWLMDGDPFVLLQLRGVRRDELLARIHRLTAPSDAPVPDRVADVDDVDLALEAALRAQRMLAELGPGT